MEPRMTDKELAERLLRVFAGYHAPVRSLAQEAARRLIDGQKNCVNCRNGESAIDPIDPDSPCQDCISGVAEGVRFAPTKWEPAEEDSE